MSKQRNAQVNTQVIHSFENLDSSSVYGYAYIVSSDRQNGMTSDLITASLHWSAILANRVSNDAAAKVSLM